MTPEGYVNTKTVIPLVTSAEFLTREEPTPTDDVLSRTRTPGQPTITASETPSNDFGDDDKSDGEEGEQRGRIPGSYGGGIPVGDDESAQWRFSVHPVWVTGIATLVGVLFL